MVFQASLANIDSVMVAGRWKKRERAAASACELEKPLSELAASGRKIAGALGLQ